jgi:hypothetical protein
MNILVNALRAAYPNIDFENQVNLKDSGGSITITAWNRQEPEPDLDALVASYDPLPDARTEALAAIRTQAKQIIEAKWPQWLQSNIALGLDPDLAQDCTDDIAAVRAASNAAEDKINAAVTVAEVEAVSASWPVL